MATNTADKKVAFYQQGYHMLLRDLEATIAWQDIVAWIDSSSKELPSGADSRAQQVLVQLVAVNPANALSGSN